MNNNPVTGGNDSSRSFPQAIVLTPAEATMVAGGVSSEPLPPLASPTLPLPPPNPMPARFRFRRELIYQTHLDVDP